MTKAKELRALAERAKAGEDIGDEVHVALGLKCNVSLAWCRGGDANDLNAVLALHKAVLGERWEWSLWTGVYGYFADLQQTARPWRNEGVKGSTPARAWLAAILRAAAVEAETS